MRSQPTQARRLADLPEQRAWVFRWAWGFFVLFGLVPPARADFLTIDFENTPRLPAGPSVFSTTAPMQTVVVPNFARVTGGMVLGDPTFLASFPAHGSAPNLYGTVFFNSNFAPAITIDFDPTAVTVSKVTGVVFNGLTLNADFVVEASNGANIVDTAFLNEVPDTTDPNSFANFTLAAARITRVQVFSEDQQTFDYLIDNIRVTFTAIPEPSSLILISTGLLFTLSGIWRSRTKRTA